MVDYLNLLGHRVMFYTNREGYYEYLADTFPGYRCGFAASARTLSMRNGHSGSSTTVDGWTESQAMSTSMPSAAHAKNGSLSLKGISGHTHLSTSNNTPHFTLSYCGHFVCCEMAYPFFMFNYFPLNMTLFTSHPHICKLPSGLLAKAVILIAMLSLSAITGNALPTDFYASSSALSQGKWARVQVKESGMQLISNSTLKSLGFTDPDKVNVYGFGGRMLSERLNESMPDDLPVVPLNQDSSGNRVLRTREYFMEFSSRKTQFIHSRSESLFRRGLLFHQRPRPAARKPRRGRRDKARVGRANHCFYRKTGS